MNRVALFVLCVHNARHVKDKLLLHALPKCGGKVNQLATHHYVRVQTQAVHHHS